MTVSTYPLPPMIHTSSFCSPSPPSPSGFSSPASLMACSLATETISKNKITYELQNSTVLWLLQRTQNRSYNDSCNICFKNQTLSLNHAVRSRCKVLKSLSKFFGTSRGELSVMCMYTEVNVPSTDWLMSTTTNCHFCWCLWCFSHRITPTKKNLWDIKVTRLLPIYAANKVQYTEQCQQILKGTIII